MFFCSAALYWWSQHKDGTGGGPVVHNVVPVALTGQNLLNSDFVKTGAV